MDIYFIVFMLLQLLKGALAQHIAMSREYCRENFHPKCNQGEVVVMTKAVYGRMKVGRCMTNDYNLPSCSQNMLQHFDRICSGRWECSIQIPDHDLTDKLTCLPDKSLGPYLEASYVCEKVYMPPRTRCISQEKKPATKKMNIIASTVSAKTSCGLHESPWLLEAKEGQNIILKLADFSWKNTTSGHSNPKCDIKYGYILDMLTDDVINICGGGAEREKQIYQSSGHSVQIVLEAAAVGNYNFLIRFQAMGCPKYEPPMHSWAQEENNTLLIRCEHSSVQWRLRCIDDMWLGVVGSCPSPPTTVKVMTPKIASSVSKSTRKGGIPLISDNHVVAFSLMCVTLVICCFVVVSGFHCTKRYELNILKKTSTNMTPIYKPTIPQNGTVRSSIIYRAVQGRDTLPVGSITDLPPYTSPVPREDRAPKLPQRRVSQTDNMVRSQTDSDYLAPVGDGVDDGSVLYYILENPADSLGTMSEEMYQSIHLHNSLESNKI